tara:strand:- start:578 stop:763 length:186 start_codon:yes stop_codon:yes gene_type:complete
MTDHEQSMQIIQQIQQLLAEASGTLKDHQQRINSVNFIGERLMLLEELQSAVTQVEVPVAE